MESDKLITHIQSSTYVVLRNVAHHLLESRGVSKDEAYFRLVTLPTDFIKSICEDHSLDIWKHLAIPEEKIPLSYMAIKAIVEKEDTQIQSVMKFASFISNPLISKAKDELMDSNEDKAVKLVALNGRSSALSIYEELALRGVTLEKIKDSIYKFYFGAIGIENPKNRDIKGLMQECETQEFKDSAKRLAKEGLGEVSKVAKDLSKKAKGFFKDFTS